MILTHRPIKAWPAGWRDRGRQTPAPFRSNYSQTLNLLDHELEMIGARSAQLQIDASERDVRLDGQLRADARVSYPGVILTVETAKRGTLVVQTDRFTTWQDNVRAIALGLEALRKVERYGIADSGQQYAGYRELGSGLPMGPAMSPETAAALLIEYGSDDVGGSADPGDLIGSPEFVAAHYRRASKLSRYPAGAPDPDLVSLYDGLHGANPEAFPRQSESGIRTRRKELTDAGLVEDSGETVTLESGRKATVWRVARG